MKELIKLSLLGAITTMLLAGCCPEEKKVLTKDEQATQAVISFLDNAYITRSYEEFNKMISKSESEEYKKYLINNCVNLIDYGSERTNKLLIDNNYTIDDMKNIKNADTTKQNKLIELCFKGETSSRFASFGDNKYGELSITGKPSEDIFNFQYKAINDKDKYSSTKKIQAYFDRTINKWLVNPYYK